MTEERGTLKSNLTGVDLDGATMDTSVTPGDAAPKPADAAPVDEAALAENATLTGRLAEVLTDPGRAAVPVPAAGGNVQQEINAITEEYFATPAGEDKEALGKLLLKHGELTRRAALIEQQRAAAIQENQRRAVATNAELQTNVTEFVKSVDPTLPMPLFWACTGQATSETPPELRQVPGQPEPAEKTQRRLDWQAKRAIVLARQSMKPQPAPADTRSARSAANAPAAASVTPGRTGGQPPAGAPAAPDKPLTFVEQLWARKARSGIE